MKTKKLLINSIIGLSLLFTSCEPQESVLKEITPEACLETLTKYFPYSMDEHFVFYNETLNHRIEADAYDKEKKGKYPNTFLEYEVEGDSASTWRCSAHACMFNSGINQDSVYWSRYWLERISAYIFHTPSESEAPMEMAWRVDLRLSLEKPQEYFTGYLDVHCKKSELASLLTDTITLPIQDIYTHSIADTTRNGSFVRIVRNVGIYDFSLDGGKTVWRRVKE